MDTGHKSSFAPRSARRFSTLILVAFVSLLPTLILAQSSFISYERAQGALAFVAEELPSELKAGGDSSRPRVWEEWIRRHDREIRGRLQQGDDDTIVNWLLFGSSFTRQPRALLDGSVPQEALRQRIATRTKDLIAALYGADTDERLVFARQVLSARGLNTDQPANLERHLYAEVDRVVTERQRYMLREEAAPADDVIGQVIAQSNLFRDRGLSLDTSILASFTIDQALEKMQSDGLLSTNSIRRVAVIGPGLDFADKNSGFDFYPIQTMQPFTTIDSLARLGLSPPAEIELTTLDISPRVHNHIAALRDRGRNGAAYLLRATAELNAGWVSALTEYWKQTGNRIGMETPVARPEVSGVEVRAVEIRPQVAARVTPVDFNIVTTEWTGPPFDLVIATNVLVYYDKLDQSFALASIETLLRPGGFFLTNNVIVEPPGSTLRAVGLTTVQHSPEKLDRVFWYRRSDR